MKILIIDDHLLVIEGISLFLSNYDENTTIFSATNYHEAMTIMMQHPDLDLILLDFVMPGIDGNVFIQEIRASVPATPIVVLSGYDDVEIIQQAIQHGAKGFIPKSSTRDVIISAIRLVFSGGIYLPQEVLERGGVDLPQTNNAMMDNHQRLCDHTYLTKRQHEILLLISKGRTNKEIANRLGLTEATIRTHTAHIFKKLNVRNRTEASQAAAKLGL